MENETEVAAPVQTGQQPLNELLWNIAKIVMEYRYDNRVTIAALGEKAGVSEPTIHNIENGKVKNISFGKLIAVANACGVKVLPIATKKL